MMVLRQRGNSLLLLMFLRTIVFGVNCEAEGVDMSHREQEMLGAFRSIRKGISDHMERLHKFHRDSENHDESSLRHIENILNAQDKAWQSAFHDIHVRRHLRSADTENAAFLEEDYHLFNFMDSLHELRDHTSHLHSAVDTIVEQHQMPHLHVYQKAMIHAGLATRSSDEKDDVDLDDVAFLEKDSQGLLRGHSSRDDLRFRSVTVQQLNDAKAKLKPAKSKVTAQQLNDAKAKIKMNGNDKATKSAGSKLKKAWATFKKVLHFLKHLLLNILSHLYVGVGVKGKVHIVPVMGGVGPNLHLCWDASQYIRDGVQKMADNLAVNVLTCANDFDGDDDECPADQQARVGATCPKSGCTPKICCEPQTCERLTSKIVDKEKGIFFCEEKGMREKPSSLSFDPFSACKDEAGTSIQCTEAICCEPTTNVVCGNHVADCEEDGKIVDIEATCVESECQRTCCIDDVDDDASLEGVLNSWTEASFGDATTENPDMMSPMQITTSGSKEREMDQSQHSRGVFKMFKLALKRVFAHTVEGVASCDIPEQNGFRFCLDISVLYPGLAMVPLPSVDWIMGYNIKSMACIHSAFTDVLSEFATEMLVDPGSDDVTESSKPPKRRKDYCTPKAMQLLERETVFAGMDARTYACQIYSDKSPISNKYQDDDAFARGQFVLHHVEGTLASTTAHTCPSSASDIGTEGSRSLESATATQTKTEATGVAETLSGNDESKAAMAIAEMIVKTFTEGWSGIFMNNKGALEFMKTHKAEAGLNDFTDAQIESIARRIFPLRPLPGFTKQEFVKEINADYVGLVVWEIQRGWIHNGAAKVKLPEAGVDVRCSNYQPPPGKHPVKIIRVNGHCSKDGPTEADNCKKVTYRVKYEVGGWVLCDIPHASIVVPESGAKFHRQEEVSVKTKDSFCPRIVPGRLLLSSPDADGYYPMRLAKYGAFDAPLINFNKNSVLGTNIHGSQIIVDDVDDVIIVKPNGITAGTKAKIVGIACREPGEDIHKPPKYRVKMCGTTDRVTDKCNWDSVETEVDANTLATDPTYVTRDMNKKLSKDTVVYAKNADGAIVEALLDGIIMDGEGNVLKYRVTPTDVESKLLGQPPKRDSNSAMTEVDPSTVLTFHKGEAVNAISDDVYSHRFKCTFGQDSRLDGVVLGVESETWSADPFYRVRFGSSIGSTVYQDIQDESYVVHNIIVVVRQSKLQRNPEGAKTYRVCTGGALNPVRLPGKIIDFDGHGTYTVEYGYETLFTSWTSLGFETGVDETRIVAGVVKPGLELFVKKCDESAGKADGNNNGCSNIFCVPFDETDETNELCADFEDKDSCEAERDANGERVCRYLPPSRRGRSALGQLSEVDYANSNSVTLRYQNFELEKDVPFDQLVIPRDPITCVKRMPGVKGRLKCLARFGILELAKQLLSTLQEMKEVSDRILKKFPQGPCADSLMFTFGLAPGVGWPMGVDVSLTECGKSKALIGELAETLRSSSIGRSPCDGSPDEPYTCEANEERDMAMTDKFSQVGSFVSTRSVASENSNDELTSCKKLNVVAHIRVDLSLLAPVVSTVKKFALLRAQNGLRSNLISIGVDQVITQATHWIKYALQMNPGSLGLSIGISVGPIHHIALCFVQLAKLLFSKMMSVRTPTCLKICGKDEENSCDPNDRYAITSTASVCEEKKEILWTNRATTKTRCIHCRSVGDTCKLDSDCEEGFKCHDNFVGLINGATEGVCREKDGQLMGGELCRYESDCVGAKKVGTIGECSLGLLDRNRDKSAFGVCAPPWSEKWSFYKKGSPTPKPGGFRCSRNDICASNGKLTADCTTFDTYHDCESGDRPHCKWVIEDPNADLKRLICIDATNGGNACHKGRCVVVPSHSEAPTDFSSIDVFVPHKLEKIVLKERKTRRRRHQSKPANDGMVVEEIE